MNRELGLWEEKYWGHSVFSSNLTETAKEDLFTAVGLYSDGDVFKTPISGDVFTIINKHIYNVGIDTYVKRPIIKYLGGFHYFRGYRIQCDALPKSGFEVEEWAIVGDRITVFGKNVEVIDAVCTEIIEIPEKGSYTNPRIVEKWAPKD